MKILILDFLQRWWWMLALIDLFSTALGAAGYPFIFAPAALLCLIMDAQRGVFRAVRVLPIPSRAQARAWWFIAVPLLPLLAIPALAIGTLIYQATHAPVMIPTPAEFAAIGATGGRMAQAAATQASGILPWFATMVQAWVALGYAGLCFLLVLGLPTRPAEGAAETAVQMLFGGLWGLSMPALMFILPYLPRVPANITPWHWVVFAASPVCVLFSLLAAPEVMQRRTVVVAIKARPRAASGPMVHESGLTGTSLLIVNFFLRFMAVFAAITIGQLVFTGWMTGKSNSFSNPAMGTQFVTIAIVFGTISAEVIGLRVLRMLPLSTARLAWLLAGCPMAAGVSAAAFTALVLGIGDPTVLRLWNFAAQALAFSGCGVLALAITLHLASGARLLILVVLGTVPAVLLAVFASHPAGFALGGTATGLLGFALLQRGLRTSSTFYQPRRIFGVGAGQASGVR